MGSYTIGEGIPKHLGFIVHNFSKRDVRCNLYSENFIRGIDKLIEICTESIKIGIECITIYGKSNDSFNKESEDEFIKAIEIIYKNINLFVKYGIKIKVIESYESIDIEVSNIIDQVEKATSTCESLMLLISYNYNGKQELLNAINKIIIDSKENKVDKITEDIVEDYLYTKHIPEPDMIINLGGIYKTGGFLLWKGSYAELMFVTKYWFDFEITDLKICLDDYANRTINRGR